MSAYHRNVLVERFIAGGGELPHSVVVGIGPDWYEDIKTLRREGCFIEREGNVWRLDLDTLPEAEPVDVGRVATAAESREAWEGCDNSSGTDELTLGIDGGERRPASPYDPSVEAA